MLPCDQGIKQLIHSRDSVPKSTLGGTAKLHSPVTAHTAVTRVCPLPPSMAEWVGAAWGGRCYVFPSAK